MYNKEHLNIIEKLIVADTDIKLQENRLENGRKLRLFLHNLLKNISIDIDTQETIKHILTNHHHDEELIAVFKGVVNLR